MLHICLKHNRLPVTIGHSQQTSDTPEVTKQQKIYQKALVIRDIVGTGVLHVSSGVWGPMSQVVTEMVEPHVGLVSVSWKQ